MARPTKHPDEKRAARVEARVTVAELEYIKRQAHIARLDVSEYVRRRTLDYVVPSRSVRRSDPSLVTAMNRLSLELRAVGNNANQIARAANAGGPSSARWLDVAHHISELGALVSALLEQIVLDDS